MSSVNPVISVITVVLNNAEGFRQTARSVINLQYPGIEFIVIDGGSTDGTVDAIKARSEHIVYWISEPDKGIYDAMNKGLAKATGEWVNFMNAGDVFFDSHVLSGIFSEDHEGAEMIYGDSIAKYPGFQALRKARPTEFLWKGMICCHQSMFIRTDLIKNEGYRSGLHFSADYEMILRLYNEGKKFLYVPQTIAIFDTRGISNMEMVRSARSNLEILRSFRALTKEQKIFHRRFISKSILTEWVYKCLPLPVINSFLKWLYRNQIVRENPRS